MEVFAQDGEGEAVFAVLGPGEIFGEAAALEGTRRTASVRARESCELLRLEASELNAVLARHTGVRQRMEETIQGRAEARERRLPGSGLARPIEDDA